MEHCSLAQHKHCEEQVAKTAAKQLQQINCDTYAAANDGKIANRRGCSQSPGIDHCKPRACTLQITPNHPIRKSELEFNDKLDCQSRLGTAVINRGFFSLISTRCFELGVAILGGALTYLREKQKIQQKRKVEVKTRCPVILCFFRTFIR